MAKIAILERKCTGCGLCAGNCPFGAIDMKDGKPELNAACKVCGICVKSCPEKAILKLETNVDDCSGEALGFLMDQLLEAGALDVFFTPVYMKKNRPAVLLSVICDPGLRETMEEILFRHTTSIGIRYQKMQRTKLQREIREFETPLGRAQVKICSFRDEVYCYPEHESVAQIARSSGLGYSEVYNILKTYAVTHANKA